MSRIGPEAGAGFAATMVIAALLGTGPALGQLPAPRPSSAGASAQANPAAMETARAAFEALPLATRIEIQDGLVWTGDYTGSLDGTFGRMTFESLTAFQARHKFAPDGILTAPAAKALAEVAKAKRAEVGFAAVDDAATGVRIHLPTRLLGRATRHEGGSRWVGRGGALRVETYAMPDGDLAQIYERMKQEAPGRKVVYAVLRPDWFVVSDETAERHGYARFVRGPSGVRGFFFSTATTLGPAFDRVVIATAGHFEPFPGAVPAAGATAPTTASPQTPATVLAPSAAPPASGVVVAPGKVLTAASVVARCASVTVGGKAATIATTDARGIATLTFSGGPAGALRLADAVPGAATVVAMGDIGGRAGVVATPGEIRDGRLRAALQRGGHGAPILDASGALTGLVGERPDESRAIAGLIAPAVYAPTEPGALAAAVAAAGGTVAPPEAAGAALTTGRATAAWVGRVVAIDCRR